MTWQPRITELDQDPAMRAGGYAACDAGFEFDGTVAGLATDFDGGFSFHGLIGVGFLPRRRSSNPHS